MKMGVLKIGADEVRALNDAMARARARPVTIEKIMKVAEAFDQDTVNITLADRARIPQIDERFAQHVELPVGYRVSISFEQQPAGMCLHLSMASGAPGKVPGPDAVSMVLTAIGMDGGVQEILNLHGGRIWFEDFLINGKPGGRAVNVVVLLEDGPVGHA
jgi:hypothetical protein